MQDEPAFYSYEAEIGCSILQTSFVSALKEFRAKGSLITTLKSEDVKCSVVLVQNTNKNSRSAVVRYLKELEKEQQQTVEDIQDANQVDYFHVFVSRDIAAETYPPGEIIAVTEKDHVLIQLENYLLLVSKHKVSSKILNTFKAVTRIEPVAQYPRDIQKVLEKRAAERVKNQQGQQTNVTTVELDDSWLEGEENTKGIGGGSKHGGNKKNKKKPKKQPQDTSSKTKPSPKPTKSPETPQPQKSLETPQPQKSPEASQPSHKSAQPPQSEKSSADKKDKQPHNAQGSSKQKNTQSSAKQKVKESEQKQKQPTKQVQEEKKPEERDEEEEHDDEWVSDNSGDEEVSNGNENEEKEEIAIPQTVTKEKSEDGKKNASGESGKNSTKPVESKRTVKQAKKKEQNNTNQNQKRNQSDTSEHKAQSNIEPEEAECASKLSSQTASGNMWSKPTVNNTDVPCVNVTCIVNDNNGNILLVKRKNPPCAWALPGGPMKNGETVEQTAIRQCQSTTGLTVVLSDILYVYSSLQSPGHTNVNIVYISNVDPLSKNKRPVLTMTNTYDELCDAKFFSVSDLPDMQKILPQHTNALRDFVLWKGSAGVRRPDPNTNLAQQQQQRSEGALF